MLEHLKDYAGLELRGQVAPLVGPSRYAVMAGELFIPSAEFKLARIEGIQEICSYKGRLYRPG